MKLITYLYIIIFCCCLPIVSVSQVSELRYDLHPPLKIPLTFSGSFGELRKTHFHSGVDLKTNGKCGYRIYASEDGYVARIVVSPVGYGRAVYVKHSNGLMTVYAHLRNFAPFIEKYVRRQQYKNETWALDVGIGKEKLPVKKGMILGFSGNSGSSGGPHLHYEVRDDSTQEPINPFFYFKPKDNIKPKIQQLYVYRLDNGRDVFSCPVDKYRVDYINRGFVLHKIKEIKASGVLGFGIKVKDFINGSWNSCGVYSLKMFVNDELRYKYEADRFSFSNTSCVNVVKDYKLDIEKNIKIYKAWMPESCCFECVKHSKDNGFVRVEKDSTYNIRFEVSDIVGNKSVFAYKIKGIEGKKVELTSAKKKYVAGKSYKIRVGDLKVYMGKKALFGDVSFDSRVDTIKNKGFYKDLVYSLDGDYVPLRSKVRLAIAIDENIASKAYFVNGLNGKEVSSIGGWVKKDTLFCKVKNLGRYSVRLDSVAPKIIPLRKYSLKRFGNNGRMFFRIEEKGSGLAKYEGRIDGVWVLTSYDAKRNMVECVFDKKRIKTGSKHNFELTVSDNCGNISKYKAVIYF